MCRCHEDSVGLGREEAAARGGGERERGKQGRVGLLGGVKRLTVCYHGNATPLRQEESLNPARYGLSANSLSQYTPSTALSRVPAKEQREESDDEGGFARRGGRRG